MIDLHMHSRYSDGSDTPAQILQNAQKIGLSLLSITDHNRVGAYDDLADPSVRSLFDGKIIKGCEFTTVFHGEIIEILGYGFKIPPVAEFLRPYIKTREQEQQETFDTTMRKYKSIGVHLEINEGDFDPSTMFARPFIYQNMTQFEENKRFFVDEVDFTRYDRFIRNESYNVDSPLFIDALSGLPAYGDIVRTIHAAGGKAFIAHLYVYPEKINAHPETLLEQVSPDGFECYYSKFTPEQTKTLRAFCRKNDLLISGGSDYHGSRRPEVNLGIGCGDLCVNEEDVMQWVKNYL